jgi:hypothetical protein
VARAKRTNRAEARRRYRAQVAAESTGEAIETPARQTAQPSSRNVRPVTEPPRTGLRYAFRASLRTPNLREDLDHIDEIVGSRGLWVAVASTIGTALVLIATTGADTLSRIVAPYLLLPIPIISVFVAGFFARRASYVNGAIVAIVAALALQAVFALNPASLGLIATANANNSGATASPSPAATTPAASASPAATAAPSTSPAASASAGSASASPNPSPAPTAQPVTEEMVRTAKTDLTSQSITTIPLSIFLASAAAWYRRFLRLGNPNRPPPRGGQRGRPNNRRR